MDNQVIQDLLLPLQEQGYPLTITMDEAKAMLECIQRITKAVPEDDHPFITADYALVTAALWHPEPESSF